MAAVIIGGIKRIAKVAEIVVPFMVVFYMGGAFICIFANLSSVPTAFKLIFTEAFKVNSAACGVFGYGIQEAVKRGVSRGVFSNEAGLGASVIAHSTTDVKEPAIQGMWGMFEVFIDTIVVCTITSIVILTSGVYNIKEYIVGLSQGKELLTGAELSAKAFEATFGAGGSIIVSLCIVLFAFASIIGWSYYGEKCSEYIFGVKAVIPYKITFSVFVLIGAVSDIELVWSISDIFNGLMAVPNLIAVLILSDEVYKITRKYLKSKRI